MEQPVTFVNRNGKQLRGIVHVPLDRPPEGRRIGINLLNPGIKYRVAPNRLNVIIARELCKQGYHVLRFDPEGIGDSEGDLPANLPVADIWGKIQQGMLVGDTHDANVFFRNNFGIGSICLMGTCGGAITALLASPDDASVDSLCLVNPPIYLMDSRKSFADVAAAGSERQRWLFSEYVKRIARPGSWYRMLTLQTNYGALWKTVARQFKGTTGSWSRHDYLETVCRQNNLNHLFFSAFEQFFGRGGHILFVLAQNDHGTELFRSFFQEGYLRQKYDERTLAKRLEIVQIEKANHVYAMRESQQALLHAISCWMGARAYPRFSEEAEHAGKR